MQNNGNSAQRPAPVLVIFLIFPLIGIVTALAILNSGTQQGTPIALEDRASAPTAFPTPARRVAVDFRLAALGDTQVQLSDYRGRVVFLNFWATWCEPCLREMPAFVEFQAQQDENGAAVLLINMGEDRTQVAAFVEQLGVGNLPILLDPGRDVSRAYAVELLPTTLIIDALGVVQYTRYGELTVAEMDTYLDAVGGAAAPTGDS